MHEPNVRHSYVKVNGSFVHLAQYGNHSENIVRTVFSPTDSFFCDHSPAKPSAILETSTSSSSSSSSKRTKKDDSTLPKPKIKKLIVFVPGNPGMLGVYHDFLVQLYKNISPPASDDRSLVIIGISHNNFDHPDYCEYKADERICIEHNDLNFVERSLAKGHKLHDIELQVLNKMIILKRLFKVDYEQCQVVFIGHSFGCHIILRLLQDRKIAAAHAGSIMIHPALENLATTEKGLVVSKYFAFKLDYVLKFATYLVEKLVPRSGRVWLTKQYCSPKLLHSASQVVIESMAQMTNMLTMTSLIEMAKSEFAHVRDINPRTMIEPHVDRLKLIYAMGDHWVNANNREELAELYPTLHIEEQSTPHAFIMDPEVVVDYALKVAMFVQDFFN